MKITRGYIGVTKGYVPEEWRIRKWEMTWKLG